MADSIVRKIESTECGETTTACFPGAMADGVRKRVDAGDRRGKRHRQGRIDNDHG